MNENKDLRDAFFDEVFKLAQKDKNLIFLTSDMGAFSLEKFKKELPEQFINMGISEQNMLSVAAGLCLTGKKVFAYSIAPFITFRPFEQLKNDICSMNLPITLISVGSGLTYGSDGPTHHAIQDIAVLKSIPELHIYNPSDSCSTSACANIAYNSTAPTYIRIERGKLPLLHSGKSFKSGTLTIQEGKDICILSSGYMVHTSIEVAKSLKEQGFSAAVVDIFCLKPLKKNALIENIKKSKTVICIEENIASGGLGTSIAEIIAEEGINKPFMRISLPDENCFRNGTRDELLNYYGLNAKSITKKLLNTLLK